MVGRYRVPAGVLSYVKLHLYPPTETFITYQSFCQDFESQLRRQNFVYRYAASGTTYAIPTVPIYLARKALKQLEDEGFLRWRFIPRRDSDGLVHVGFPLPDIYTSFDIPSSLRKYCVLPRHRWFGQYQPRKGFKPDFFYNSVVYWERGRWVYLLKDNWHVGLFKYKYHPKKKYIDRLKKRVPVVLPDWDGKGYEILKDSDPYIQFAQEHGLRMDPQDDDYNMGELYKIWKNLKTPASLHECPLCGLEVTFKPDSRSKKAKYRAKLHKPTCDLAVVDEVMEH